MCVFILLKTGSYIPVPLYFKYETSTLLECFCHFSVKNIMGNLDIKLPFKCSRMIKMIRSRFSSYLHLLTSVSYIDINIVKCPVLPFSEFFLEERTPECFTCWYFVLMMW